MHRIKRVLAPVLALMVLTSPAFAHTQTRLDGDDSAGALDLVAARQKHQGSPKKLILKLVTYEKWQQLGGMTFVSFEFDKNNDGEPERCLDIALDGTLQSTMYKGTFAGCVQQFEEQQVGTRLASRPDQHSIKVAIPERWLSRNSKAYRWRAATSFEEEHHADCPPPENLPPERRYGTCVDFTRWKRHSF
ncbi:MAG: hypothetical protein M3N53_06180 [Actinomycetota bacterium]|nr:hypothetical protein [Actinomycetota bacterium]